MTYKMCEMQRNTELGMETTIGWIPSKLAFIGSIVALKDPETNKWSNGWLVKSATQEEPAKIFERKHSTFGPSLEDRLRA